MSTEETLAYVKLALLTVIAILLFQLVMTKENMDAGPLPASQANPVTTWASDKTGTTNDGVGVGASFASVQPFINAPPNYWPMADEDYLNKYLYSNDPGALTGDARTGLGAPILARLNAAAGTGYPAGNKGVNQMTDDLLVLYEMGGGQCGNNGAWTLDPSSCPGGSAAIAGTESFNAQGLLNKN